MKMAKASPDDFKTMSEFFQLLEEWIVEGTITTDCGGENEQTREIDGPEVSERIKDAWKKIGPAWPRIVWGCEMLIGHCCDPDSDTLDWRPDIRRFLETQEAAEAAGAGATDERI